MSLSTAACLICALVLLAAPSGFAHETMNAAAGAQPSGAAAADDVETIIIEVDAEGDGVEARVVRTRPGTHIQLKVIGAGGHDLHLHGIDAAFAPQPDGSVIAAFETRHVGRFRLEMHVEDALLGTRDKPLLYLEVRSK